MVERVANGRTVNPNVGAMIVPGSGTVKEQARRSLHRIFIKSRLRLARARLLHVPGDNPDRLRARRALRLDLEQQFRGPSGLQRRTHLVSPARRRPPRSPAGCRCADMGLNTRGMHAMLTGSHGRDRRDRISPSSNGSDRRRSACHRGASQGTNDLEAIRRSSATRASCRS